MQAKARQAALEWYLDNGVDETLADAPANRFALAPKPVEIQPAAEVFSAAPVMQPPGVPQTFLGKSDARSEAIKLAAACNTLDELREAIAGFDGLAIRKTATNMVFADGNPQSPIMLVGEAPGGDEDRLGKPFVGVSGQLLDRIFASIGISRADTDPKKSVYISNILNWRPPGNRTPSPAEVEISLPFIEKHIMLAQPKIVILCGGVSAKALLGTDESISKLRKTTWRDYRPQTAELGYSGSNFSIMTTYHPAYLLRTPSQKRAVWADMLALDAKRDALELK